MNILIVGSGVVGLTTAFELSLAGYRVRILTRNYEEGASWVAGGMLAPFSEGLEGDILRFSVSSLRMYPEFLRRLREVSRSDLFFRMDGTVRIALSDEEFEDIGRKAELYRSLGFRVEELSEGELSEEGVAPERVRGAFLFGDEGNVDAGELMDLLLLASEVLGVGIEVEEVVEVSGFPEEIKCLRGLKDTYRADFYIFTAGAWSGRLLGVPVFPMKGQILRVRGVKPRRVCYSKGSYVVPKRNYTVLGATSERVGLLTVNYFPNNI